MIPFRKMHGLGNDFCVFDARRAELGMTPERAARVADRQRGVGCDQVIVLEPTGPGADVFMRILNPDGSEAGACGNATRCVASLVADELGRDSVTIRTISGELPVRRLSVAQGWAWLARAAVGVAGVAAALSAAAWAVPPPVRLPDLFPYVSAVFVCALLCVVLVGGSVALWGGGGGGRKRE